MYDSKWINLLNHSVPPSRKNLLVSTCRMCDHQTLTVVISFKVCYSFRHLAWGDSLPRSSSIQRLGHLKDEHFRPMHDTLMGNVYSRATHEFARTWSSCNTVWFLFLANLIFFTVLSRVLVLTNISSQCMLLKNPTYFK